MGQIISIVVSSAYEIYNRRRRPLEIENEPMQDINILPEDWAWNQRYNDDAFNNELNKLKRLISANLVKTTNLNRPLAIKGIKNENLENNYAKYLCPSEPIWYGPYKTVELYIERQTISFDTLMSYSFNKTNDFYLVRFTDGSNKLNLNLIRQMYHCLELFWVQIGNHIDNRSQGNGIIFYNPFGRSQIEMSIRSLRSMYGYYNSKRNSRYIQDRFIIADFMKLIPMMFGKDNNIVGYYYNDNVFHTEFTILGDKQRDVLIKPKQINSSISKNGTRVWALGGGVKLYDLEPTLYTLQQEPTKHTLQQEPTKHTLQQEPTKHTLQQEPTKYSLQKHTLIPAIENNDEFIQIMQEFFNYQYQCELFDIPEFELSNIRIKQLELKQKALLLITDKNVYKFADNFLDCYTISPIKNVSGLGIKSKSKRRTKVKRRKNKSRKLNGFKS
jgi:hypothetical protein